jgi:hypothetical protein
VAAAAAAAAANRPDSVQGGFLSVGVGAEELKTLSLPASTKGKDLLSEKDFVITGREKKRPFKSQLQIFYKVFIVWESSLLL